ncbi:MAG: hypothetical protein NVS3B26_27300 [Mycobacteriales bacterium]
MSATVTEDAVRRLYVAYAANDIGTIDGLMAEDAVVHVPGGHPLSGEHRGKPSVWAYLGKIVDVGQGKGGSTCTVSRQTTKATGSRCSPAPSGIGSDLLCTSGESRMDGSLRCGRSTWTKTPKTASGSGPSRPGRDAAARPVGSGRAAYPLVRLAATLAAKWADGGGLR